ncbi:hypothetical protein FQZ97_424850 [compost metagenome]
MLVLHFGAELGGLEQPFSVPHQGRQVGWQLGHFYRQPLVEEGDVAGLGSGNDHRLGLLDQTVVLGVEHVVHGGQGDVFVDPTVAGDVVGIEQFVVVGTGCRHRVMRTDNGVGIRLQGCSGLAIARVGGMGDVVEEGMAGADAERAIERRSGTAHRNDRCAIRVGARDQLRIATGTRNEVAIGIGDQQRQVERVKVIQFDTENVAGLGLDVAPGGHAAVGTGDQLAGGHRAIGGQHVLTQEGLVRGVRGIGLVLVDEGGGQVDLAGDVVVGPQLTILSGKGDDAGTGQHHELLPGIGQLVTRAGNTVRTMGDERVILLQRYEYGATAALLDQVQAVVEELPEEGEPGVEASRQAFVRRGVGDHQYLPGLYRLPGQRAGHMGQHAVHFLGHAGIDVRLQRRRVVAGLVDDQVGDGPRLRVIHEGARISWRRGIARAVHRIDQMRKEQIGRTEAVLPRLHMVAGTIDGPQAPWHLGVGQQFGQWGPGGMRFGDEDLLKDELQVGFDEVGHFIFPQSG